MNESIWSSLPGGKISCDLVVLDAATDCLCDIYDDITDEMKWDIARHVELQETMEMLIQALRDILEIVKQMDSLGSEPLGSHEISTFQHKLDDLQQSNLDFRQAICAEL
jgi:hypothetical protein